MPAILYTVRTTCPSLQVRGRFLAWPATRDWTSRAVALAKAG
ncbi:MAG: hypothetical protein PSW75_07115 [bacterium]|nr:hypothetical protein [bacterium]MDI1338042.1 hypothetical protein [Lacunisphaera sp.]